MDQTRNDHLPIEILVAKTDHKIGYIKGTGSRLVVSMSGIGNRRRFFPPWEFIRTASNGGRNHVLLVTERARTWMNAPELATDIAHQIDAIKSSENIKDVVAIGNSMGGFMALVLPQYTDVNRVVATSPQFSMSSTVVPEDKRWSFWRARLQQFQHETIGDIDISQREYFILHGSTKNENYHWGRFPYHPDLHHYIIQGKGHSVVVAMKGSGVMNDVLRLAVDGKPDAAISSLATKFKPIRRCDLPENERYLW